ncbi:MAG: tetratricopeptide repeat protein [Clostridium sp.]|nr:tetratricopeptide repeat protein [Clostridium sp.]MDU7084373.1 tetratricopeptide repeat protein [Clostridium sp.]
MSFRKIPLLLGIFISFICCIIFVGCAGKDKEIVISDDIEQVVHFEESEVEKYISEGNKFLSENNYGEARKSYDTALAKESTNKQLYLDIKDKYIKAKRYDDAYYIIKLAIKNNVDTEEMNEILVDIRNMMETEYLFFEKYKGDTAFELTDEVVINVGEGSVIDYIVWSDWDNSIDNVGEYIFHGVTKEYGRNIVATLNIHEKKIEYEKEIKDEKKIGFVRDILVKDDKIYISYDEVEFFRDEEAYSEKRKDGKMTYDNEGNEILWVPYYIRNTYENEVTYKVAESATYNLCYSAIDPYSDKSGDGVEGVDFDTFKSYIHKYKGNKDAERALLFIIDIKLDNVTDFTMQFTP